MMYIGCFAPSSTGLLHIGSLLTVVASYANARNCDGKWLVRMEDLDSLREMTGTAEHILRTLEASGFEWDGVVAYQSRWHVIYEAALGRLKDEGLVYPCYCSRKDWQVVASAGVDGFVYSGRCRNPADRLSETSKQSTWCIRVSDEAVGFNDEVVRHYVQNLARDIGDFVLLRADGYWAYQLTVVADDAEQGVTHVVREQDLLVSILRQTFLQRCLDFETPHYAYSPLLVNSAGQKWSRQALVPALDMTRCDTLPRQVMGYLNLPPAPDTDHPHDLLDRAAENWRMAAVLAAAVCTKWFADIQQKDTDILVYAVWFQTVSCV